MLYTDVIKLLMIAGTANFVSVFPIGAVASGFIDCSDLLIFFPSLYFQNTACLSSQLYQKIKLIFPQSIH